MSAAMSSGQRRLWAAPARGAWVACAAALLLSVSAGPAAALLLGEVVYGEVAEDLEPAFVPPVSVLRAVAPGPASESRLRLPILAEENDVRPLGEQLSQEWVLPGNPGLAAGAGSAAEEGLAAPALAGASWLDALLGQGAARSDPLGALRSGLAGIAAVDEMGLAGRPGPGSFLQLPAVPSGAGLGWPGLMGGSEPGPLDELGLPDGFFLGSPLLPGSIFSGPQNAFLPGAGGPGLWAPAQRP